MLSRIYIDNYRCFVNFNFKPTAKQLVLGINGAGKSAFLDVLRAIRDFVTLGEKVDRSFNLDTRTRWQTLAQQSFELEVTGNGGTYIYTLWVEVQDSKPESRVLKETLDFDEKPLLLFLDDQARFFDDRHQKIAEYPFDSDRSALSVLGRRRTSSKLEWFKQWIAGLHCLRIDPSQMRAEAKDVEEYPDDHLTNFAAWYGHVIQEQTGSLVRLQRSLGEILSGFDSLDLKKVGRTARLLRATFAESDTASPATTKSIEFDFDELSDGQKVLIALYTILHAAIEPDTTICLDEPDNFLALSEIQPWLLELIDRIEDIGAQAILISHHPELIDLLAPDHGVVFSRNGVGPVRVEPYRPDALGKLMPSERIARGWERD
jgi:ATPase subunit of ABC transporter with duplicated ATPase domains